METKELITRYELLNGKKWLPNSFYNEALDKLGYTKALVEKRVKIYDNAADCLAGATNRNWPESIYIVVAGSRGEGMAVSLKSDLDTMFVQPAVKCFKIYPTTDSKAVENCVAAFKLDLYDVPEGYTKLRLKHIEWSWEYRKLASRIMKSLKDNNYLKNGQRLIEAVEYGGENVKRESWISKNYRFDEVTGPAQPLQFPLPFSNNCFLSFDHVQAFPCAYVSVLDDWFKRQRQNAWPSSDVLKAVKETDIFVVSVGQSGSKEEKLQWRISLTLAERSLVRSFNDTQIKVYAAMKMLVKHELKPICANITSYIVKNVIFWVFEKRSGTFQRDEFVEILLQSLIYLKDCVTVGCLPNYTIPSRNLLRGKLSQEEACALKEHLNILITEDSTVLLRCPLVYKMAELSGDALKDRLLFRELTDMLYLGVFSVPPHKFDEIQHSFHVTQNAEEYLQVYFKRLLPVIRETNPYGAFTLLKTMADEEVRSQLMKGFLLDYDKMWMD
ncbi:uncharacterized protein LOC128552495 [Mercenaria mercenaria]|uniref:uncharacterized protein LOC128552495 n=1 Tax=Mercenaria mercenaria TaxID=6596 RepID=UPI00234F1497|nr:uncharacterized protein LOC128552495 [Mercenaria mercenaria]XP_053389518.1 uncharacterized protein LOC128552495 [Mercenaria mercenaria]